MSHSVLKRAFLAAVVTIVSASYAGAQEYHANFSGFHEVPPILSNGKGTLALTIHPRLQSVNYTLTYSNLGSNVAASHIHFGKAGENGGVIVFLCGGFATPACPLPSGTVKGVITPASVIGPVAQGITAGDFDGLLRALSSGNAYGNIHTTNFPAGEIRGEIQLVQ